MRDTNYLAGIVKILETPKRKVLNRKISVTKFRVQFPQVRGNQIVHLTFWGNLAHDVTRYYKISDYILIEGYLSLRNKQTSNLTIKTSKKVSITVFKVYPFLLSSNRSMTKI